MDETKGRPAKNDSERELIKEAKEYSKAIKNSRYVLGKNSDHLTSYQETKLEMISESEPKLFKVYRLKEDLRIILHLKDVLAADTFLDV